MSADGRRGVEALLLLGGNLGDRERALRDALRGISGLPRTRLLGTSRLYETAPVGPSRRPYLNLAARIRTALSPMGLLCELKRLESLAGRRPGPRWGARPLDIDILAFGALKRRTRFLCLPHPRVSERSFVLAPLSELVPRWRPTGGPTVLELLRRLNPDARTVRIFVGDRDG